jgi:hypothetical protein
MNLSQYASIIIHSEINKYNILNIYIYIYIYIYITMYNFQLKLLKNSNKTTNRLAMSSFVYHQDLLYPYDTPRKWKQRNVIFDLRTIPVMTNNLEYFNLPNFHQLWQNRNKISEKTATLDECFSKFDGPFLCPDQWSFVNKAGWLAIRRHHCKRNYK